MHHINQLVSTLLRDVETDLGTHDMSCLFVDALKDSIADLNPCSSTEFKRQLKNFIRMLTEGKPRYASLIDVGYRLWDLVKDLEDTDHFRDIIARDMATVASTFTDKFVKAVNYGASLVEDGDTILLYNASRTAIYSLRVAKKHGRKFTVLIAEQNPTLTHTIADLLHECHIPFSVVPARMLSHTVADVDKAFFGAVTLQDTQMFVMNTGSAGIVAQVSQANIPTYIFITTNKFSLWKAESTESAHLIKEKHTEHTSEYHHVTFSHDKVNLDQFTKIITEGGVHTSGALWRLFEERYAERKKKRYDILGIK